MSKKQPTNYFTTPVTLVDQTGNGDDVSQTHFPGELFFNDEVYEYCCEGCGDEITYGYEDSESGVAYCLVCLGDMIKKGHARIEYRERVPARRRQR